VTGQRMADEVLNILGDSARYADMKSKLVTVKEKLGSSGASAKIAALVKEIINEE